MLIAHLPAGIITSHVLTKRVSHKFTRPQIKKLWIIGILFSIIPDFDLIYFYGVSSAVHHHKFFPHLPIFWLGFFALAFALLKLVEYLKSTRLHFYRAGLFIASCNILIHLLLDTFVGYIWWLYPAIDQPYFLVDIPANYSHWIISFVLHWSFIAEIIIVLFGLRIIYQRTKNKA